MGKEKRRFQVIGSPTLDLEAKYGGTWTLVRRKSIPGFQPLRMTDFSASNHCSLSSLTAIFRYYHDQGFSAIPASEAEIFQTVLTAAEASHYYHPKIGTPVFFIGKIGQAIWEAFGYGGGGKNQLYFHGPEAVEEAIFGEVDALRPAVLSFTSRLYRRHSVTLYGYAVYSNGREEAAYALVNDNWSLLPRYVEISRLGYPQETFVCLTRILPSEYNLLFTRSCEKRRF